MAIPKTRRSTVAAIGARSVSRADCMAWLAIAVAAMLASLPLLTRGYSCGHDFDFHLRSWMEASTQWKSGIVKPVWAFHAAWNAGEPRLLFYPPLSWITGSLLTLLVPWNGIVFAFTALVLFLCGITMHRLLRRWVSPGIAIFGGCLYMVNPYMLFCAYERTAYAELMAAAWMPFLLIALLRDRVTVWRVAMAIALLWITNAPAAVVGCYSVLLIGGMRCIFLLWQSRADAGRYFVRVSAGVFLGLLLDAFYLLPFAVERKYITLTAALTPAASPDANYLFEYTNDAFHNGVLLHSSTIAVVLFAVAMVSGAVTLLLERRRVRSFSGMHGRDASLLHHEAWHGTVPVLMLFSVVVFLLQTPVSSVVWRFAPELNFLQFPWRFMSVQSAVSVALLAMLMKQLAMRRTSCSATALWVAAALFIVVSAAYGLANKTFRQGCDDEEGLTPQWSAFQHGEGFEQTDEYTPTGDDNDVLKIRLPAAWIAHTANNRPASGDGSLPKGTLLPAETFVRPDDSIFSAHAEHAEDFLIVRLRPFHGWHVLLDGTETTQMPRRADGLLAVPLRSAGPHRVEVVYRTPWDQWVGGGVTLLALLGLAAIAWREESHESYPVR